ncbi:hypothetical protein QRD43_21885 [Pelomonas sp. APW6]|uniref:DUF2971 domain-containing protein n=1 Tax=Roseateles subflavus TaxID=3053353 RepID=A0ABT7LSW1_9BURK|nr:hypothetical protein [Pelomonas sp. APW6]MDL5034571.1 hypothetical protein [Pelomonas sp. APW6]
MDHVTATPGLDLAQVVRRHLDLTKYLDLLRGNSLYLRRADRFPDRLEGALTPSIRRAMNEGRSEHPDIETAEQFQLRSRVGALVSCWTMGKADNMALWQLYGGASASIAVVTTVEQLAMASIDWPDPAYIYQVKYIDHMSDPDMIVGHYTDMLQYKHTAYAFEQELRVIASRHRGNWQDTPEGVRLPIPNLKSFVREVIVAPEAQDWYVDLVADVSAKYGLNVPVRRSDLAHVQA